jgi:hypothetical protein
VKSVDILSDVIDSTSRLKPEITPSHIWVNKQRHPFIELFVSTIFTRHLYCRRSYYCHYHKDAAAADDDENISISEVLLLQGRVIPCIFMQAKRSENKLFLNVFPRSHG